VSVGVGVWEARAAVVGSGAEGAAWTTRGTIGAGVCWASWTGAGVGVVGPWMICGGGGAGMIRGRPDCVVVAAGPWTICGSGAFGADCVGCATSTLPWELGWSGQGRAAFAVAERSVRFHGNNLAARGRSSTTTIGGVLTMVGSAAVAVGAGPVFAVGFGVPARTCCPAVVFGRMAP
jgi:hypothetical protein